MRQENLQPPDAAEMKPCPDCNGGIVETWLADGEVHYDNCETCEGYGQIPKTEMEETE